MSQPSSSAITSSAAPSWPPTNGQALNGMASHGQQQQQQQQQQGEPPAKRPRLSPPVNVPSPAPYSTSSPYAPLPSAGTTQSPYATSSTGFRYPQLPHNAFPPRQVTAPFPSLNGMPTSTPQTPSTMGPPQRPAERTATAAAQPTPIKEEREANFDAINDVALSSGIDITKEEDLLRHRNRQSSHYDLYGGGFGLGERGTFGQTPEQSQQDQLVKSHERAARKAAEKQAEHLNNPFLYGNALRWKLTTIPKRDFNLNVSTEGVWDVHDKYRQREHMGTSMTHSQDGSSIVASSLQAPFSVEKGAPLESMIALLSLAGSERLRSLLEDAYGLARARQITTDGIVPPDWADTAARPDVTAENTVTKPASVTDSSWDRPNTPPATDDADSGQTKTTSFPASKDPITTALAALSQQDREAEEARLKKRAARKARRAAETAESVVAAITNGVTPERGSTPVQDGIRLTKKERDKLARADLSEEAATRNANTTAQMQLGGKSYSWMSGGSKKKTQPKPATTGSAGGVGASKTVTGGAGVAAGSKTGGAENQASAGEDTKFGVWREDGVGGKGVQMRDWVAALEVDGHEKKTLEVARAKLGREDTGL